MVMHKETVEELGQYVPKGSVHQRRVIERNTGYEKINYVVRTQQRETNKLFKM